ncbi:MAG: efflux RND transporter permease subunit, partial [Alsobacter sp.]
MSLNVSAWSIRKPIPAITLFLVLMVLGVVSFRSLPITRFPNIDIPLVSVTVTQSGAAPAELETQVTKRVENAVAGINGVKHVISAISDGNSTTSVEFRLEVNSDRALNDVKDAIARIRADLPRTIDEPVVQRVDIAGLPVLTYGASAPTLSTEELSWFVDDVVARDLQSVKGVSKVERIGGVEREIRVALDPDRLMSFGITAADVNRQLRATHVDLAGGRGEVGAREQSIRTLAGTRTLDELAETSIAIAGGRKVRLDELGTVTDGAAEARTFARLN